MSEHGTVQRDDIGRWLPGGAPPPEPRARLFQDADALQVQIDAYFIEAEAKGMTPTVAGLGAALHCSRTTLLNYEDYNDAGAVVDCIKSAKQRIEAATVNLLLQPKSGVHPAGPIFILKNCHGYQDVQRYEVDSRSVVLGVQLSEDERRAYVPQIPSNSGDCPPLGIETSSERPFASEASLSPVPVNSYPVEK